MSQRDANTTRKPVKQRTAERPAVSLDTLTQSNEQLSRQSPEFKSKSKRAVPIPKPVVAPMQRVLHRLVYEAVASRIRHRALLEVLETGAYTKERYFESYKAIYDRDHEALYAQLMLESSDFRTIFSEWHSGELERYGIPDRVAAVRKSSKSSKQ